MKGENNCKVLDFFHHNKNVCHETIKALAKSCELPVILFSEDKTNMLCINYEDGLHLAVTFFPNAKYTAILWFEAREKIVELGYWDV